MSDLYYTLEVQYDGYTFHADVLPEEQARDWLWRIVSRPMLQSSRVVIHRCDVRLYDRQARLFGYPGSPDALNPLTGKRLDFS